MTDQCWLSPQLIAQVQSLRFWVQPGKLEDLISTNLRNEIVTYFHSTLAGVPAEADVLMTSGQLPDDSFTIEQKQAQWVVSAGSTTALLHAFYFFALHYYLGDLSSARTVHRPSQALRMLNQWDNFDGSIERGYAGRSIFYANNHFIGDYARITMYARLMSSIGLNGIVLNNVNVHQEETFFITGEKLQRIKDIAAIFHRFGIKIYLSVNFAAPIQYGDLATADPLIPAVAEWWQRKLADVFRLIPNFGGVLVKADSEGQPGPYTYHRNHAEGANMLAKAVAPFGGIVIWRAFVYNSQQDWRDRSQDRARAAYDTFGPLDGQFAQNVVLQIKFGPIDFQPCEPVQPLFGALRRTNQIIEFQASHEYTGQAIDANFLMTQWEQLMAFDTRGGDESLPLRNVPRRCSPQPEFSGIAAVSNIGRDENWTGNKLAQSNLYAFGRLAWQSDITGQQVLQEWQRLTFADGAVQAVVGEMLTASNQVYVDYTAPLGVGFMVRAQTHYGPGPDDYEFDRWGTYHFADRYGVGVDRTVLTGSGYSRLYSGTNAAVYDNLATCPDALLLFFHHVPYDYRLHDGQTLIQHIYNTHFSGCQAVTQMISRWQTCAGRLPETEYLNVLHRLQAQAKNAREWRDQINTFFYRFAGIPDSQGRTIYA
jgi:alpha-glucuronidase